MKEDIVAPVPLIVIDPERTEKVRLQEAQRIATLVRYRPEAIAEAELQLHVAFVTNQQNFLNASEAELTCKLREAMSNYVRADLLPPEARIEPAQWRLVSPGAPSALPEIDAAFDSSTPVHQSEIVTLTDARKNLIASFALAEQATGKLLANFIRENCFIDVEATRLLRAAKTNSLWAADHYDAGQTIVKAGDVIDTRAKAALDKLAERLAADKQQLELVHALGKAQSDVTSLKHETQSAQNHVWWISIIAMSAGIAGFVAWRVRRASAEVLFLPEPLGDLPVLAGPNSLALSQETTLPVVASSWRARAMMAERRVDKLTRALRVRLAPHLARWLAHKFVQQLLSNRKRLLEVQQQAEAEIAEMERRLTEIRAPLQERLRAYEDRIIELEKLLLLRDQQNRELIQLTIVSARNKLERELAASMEWN